MKSLSMYLEDLFATPMNTMGMGGIIAPGPNGELGSGDIPQSICKLKQHKGKKKLKK